MKVVQLLQVHLNKIQYHILYKCFSGDVNYHFNPFPSLEMAERNMVMMDETCKDLLRFWALGLGASERTVEDLIGKDLCDELLNNKLAIADSEGIRLNNLVLISFSGHYLFVDRPTYYGQQITKGNPLNVYIGPDTYSLLDSIPNDLTGDMLELCSGSSACSIAKSDQFDKLVCIDINAAACRIGRINAALNYKNEKIEIFNGNLYDPIKQSKRCFDVIIANPPFIPVPDTIPNYPICGVGGETGLDVISNILMGVDDHLKKNGTLIISAEGLADKQGHLLNHALIEETAGKGFRIDVFVQSCTHFYIGLLGLFQYCTESLLQDFSSKELFKYAEQLKHIGAYYYERYVFRATKTDRCDEAKVNYVFLQSPLELDRLYRMSFSISNDVVHENEDCYQIVTEKERIRIDKQCYSMLTLQQGDAFNPHEYISLVVKNESIDFISECKLIKAVESVIFLLISRGLIY